MTTSLVTGGAGFIGAHVVNHLIDHLNHNVIVLDDLSGGFKENIHPDAIFIEGSITNADLINQIFEDNEIDYVYHLAAYAAEGLSHFIRNFNYTNNLIGSVNLINASVRHKIKCFVFTSSIAVYGTQDLPLRETAHPKPEDPYGIAKYAVEMDLEAAREMFGLNYIVFRPHNVYGEFQNIGDRYRNVIGIFMNQILQNKPLTIYGDGKQTRAFTYISDVAPYIAESVNFPEAYNKPINIGGDIEYTVGELAECVIEIMDSNAQIRNVDARNEVVHAWSDHTRAREVFKIDPQKMVDLKTGLKKTADWVKNHGARKTPRFEKIEVLRNLPPIWLED